MFESIAAFWAEYGNVLTDGVWDTLVMVVISTAFAYLIGLPLGVALILTQPHGIRPHRGVYRVLDWIVNIGRSVPFIILRRRWNTMFESIAAFWAEYGNVLTDGVWDTLVMVVISTAFAYLIGLPLGVALILTQPHGIRPHRGVYRVLDWIVNIGRSVPFIILMVAIMPFTRMVVGTTIGVKGAIVPLVVSAAPFIARMVETSLNEVDAGVVEAAQSMGASTLQIVWKVYLPEAKPSLILGGAISLVTILAYTAIAGTVGAGGLGDIAVRYGHQRGITSVMWVTVVFLIILVQVVQLIFNWLSRRIDKRLDQPSGAKKSGPLDLLPRFAHTK